MGRKKRRAESTRIFCYYCDREFSSEHELVHHQKEKHLRCPTCHKRMISMTGLVVHAMQVHKRTVSTVPNAIEGRDDPKVDVFGMQGIPADLSVGKHAAKRQHKGVQAGPLFSDQNAHVAGVVSQVPDVPPPAVTVSSATYAGPPMLHSASTAPFIVQSGYISQPLPNTLSYPPSFEYSADHFGSYPYFPLQSHSQFPVHRGPMTPPGWVSGPARPQARPLRDRPVINPSPIGLPVAVTPTTPVHVVSSVPLPSEGISSQNSPPSSANNNIHTTAATVTTGAKPVTKPVEIVFSHEDVCMEELRAELPRYRIRGPKPPTASSCNSSQELTGTENAICKGE